MIGSSHVIYPLTNNDSVNEFYKGLEEQTKILLGAGYIPSEIEFHYQQSDKYISCLIVAKKDK